MKLKVVASALAATLTFAVAALSNAAFAQASMKISISIAQNSHQGIGIDTLAKWLALNPRVLLLDEPTRGIDVGAKQEIYRLMEDLAGRGVAILFVSSEMEEVLRMSDRALVMHEGRIAGELPRGELSEEAVMRLATGHAI